MSLPWSQRKTRLTSLLKSKGDDDADGLALDRLLHGQRVIGKTSKTTEVDSLRFQDRDLDVVGTLEYGQFGVIDVVNCRLDGRVYVRKSIEKRFALRTREQCSPQFERDILLQALKTDSRWAPHLLCAFQTPTHLSLVMDYAEGGTLWDVLESSPHDGKVLEADMRWWAPQIVSAIHWCHSQGFVHRDIKPHNFVLTPDAHVLLIDFGSAAPLLPPGPDGSQLLPKRYCLVPCGTCDYISPEILMTHEEALVALEMDDEDDSRTSSSRMPHQTNGYGLETDWWSLGAMLYEMAYGFAPFFARDIRQTYLRIMDHERSLRFDQTYSISSEYQDFLSRLLTRAERRLGRRNIMEITDHPIFDDIDWTTLPTQQAPPGLHLPQFTYTGSPATINGTPQPQFDESNSHSQGFAFSALFQSSKGSSSLGHSIIPSTPSPGVKASLSSQEDSAASFIGFSWGPAHDAFPNQHSLHTPGSRQLSPAGLDTPRPLRFPSVHLTPNPPWPQPNTTSLTPAAAAAHSYPFSTPNRPSSLTPHQTLPRASTIRRTAPRRAVSDREAMKQLVDCVGMSARKKVLESGRKPRILTNSFSRSGSFKKELRFLPSPIPVPDYRSSSQAMLAPLVINNGVSSGSEDTDSEGPPSPSPSPRPGSAMSMMSRRSGTPTMTGTFSHRIGHGTMSASNTVLLSLPPTGRSGSFLGRYGGDQTFLGSPRRPSFDTLEVKHASLMQDVREIEERIAHLSVLLGQDG